jgi:hypothetical protein
MSKINANHLQREAYVYVRHNAAEKVMAEQRMVMQ